MCSQSVLSPRPGSSGCWLPTPPGPPYTVPESIYWAGNTCQLNSDAIEKVQGIRRLLRSILELQSEADPRQGSRQRGQVASCICVYCFFQPQQNMRPGAAGPMVLSGQLKSSVWRARVHETFTEGKINQSKGPGTSSSVSFMPKAPSGIHDAARMSEQVPRSGAAMGSSSCQKLHGSLARLLGTTPCPRKNWDAGMVEMVRRKQDLPRPPLPELFPTVPILLVSPDVLGLYKVHLFQRN